MDSEKQTESEQQVDHRARERAETIAMMIEKIKLAAMMAFPEETRRQLSVDHKKGMADLVNELREMAETMRQSASRYDSMAVIIGGSYTPDNSNCRIEQSKGLEGLANFFDSLLKAQELKDRMKREQSGRAELLDHLGFR